MRNKLIWLAGTISFFIVFYFDKEVGMLYGCSLIVILGVILSRKKMWALLPAVLVSWIWVYIGRDVYSGYADVFQYTVKGVSLFPIFAWPTILFLGYLAVYPYIKAGNWWSKWIKMSIIYCFGIILFEFFGYNFAGVQLDSGTAYAGWPILNIFHCPWWMQMAYFLNGIAFFGLVVLIDYKIIARQK